MADVIDEADPKSPFLTAIDEIITATSMMIDRLGVPDEETTAFSGRDNDGYRPDAKLNYLNTAFQVWQTQAHTEQTRLHSENLRREQTQQSEATAAQMAEEEPEVVPFTVPTNAIEDMLNRLAVHELSAELIRELRTQVEELAAECGMA